MSVMHRRRRLAGIAALTVVAGGGLVAVASPASAVGAPRVTLSAGTVTVTGTGAAERIGIASDAVQLAVDLGLDGTVDARFPRSRFKQVLVFAGGGDDGVSVS